MMAHGLVCAVIAITSLEFFGKLTRELFTTRENIVYLTYLARVLMSDRKSRTFDSDERQPKTEEMPHPSHEHRASAVLRLACACLCVCVWHTRTHNTRASIRTRSTHANDATRANACSVRRRFVGGPRVVCVWFVCVCLCGVVSFAGGEWARMYVLHLIFMSSTTSAYDCMRTVRSSVRRVQAILAFCARFVWCAHAFHAL